MATKTHITKLRGTGVLALVLIGGLISTACGGNSTSAPAAGSPAPATQVGSAAPANTPEGGSKSGKAGCQALVNAAFDLNSSAPSLVTLAGAGGTVQNHVDSPLYVDTAKLRTDLGVLSALPDPTDATEISIMGKPSEAIVQYRQLFDMIDTGAKASSTPAVSDQQLAGFTVKLVKMSTSINAATDTACPGVSAEVPQIGQPGAKATPLTAGYQIGQTASVGDLRVTLDKVITSPGSGGILPEPGNHFVFAYFTVENTGKSTFQMNMLAGTHWEDAAGKQYYFDPHTIMLDPNTTNLDGGIEPAAKKSGAVGYQLPTGVGDLVWVFEDFKPNLAVFAVKASDIAALGTPVTEPTEDAMRAGAAATQTAFVGMMVGADATNEAAGTETPVPTDEPAATDVPTDTPASP